MTTEPAPPEDFSRALAEMSARLGALEESVKRMSSASAAPAPAASTGPGAQKDLESAVDQMVANALLHGRRTAGVMTGMFNVSPGLSGR